MDNNLLHPYVKSTGKELKATVVNTVSCSNLDFTSNKSILFPSKVSKEKVTLCLLLNLSKNKVIAISKISLCKQQYLWLI